MKSRGYKGCLPGSTKTIKWTGAGLNDNSITLKSPLLHKDRGLILQARIRVSKENVWQPKKAYDIFSDK